MPERLNIVVTRDGNFRADGAVVVHSLDEALLRAGDDTEVCVIGGVEIYKAALPRVGRIDLTEVHSDVEGDTHMAAF